MKVILLSNLPNKVSNDPDDLTGLAENRVLHPPLTCHWRSNSWQRSRVFSKTIFLQRYFNHFTMQYSPGQQSSYTVSNNIQPKIKLHSVSKAKVLYNDVYFVKIVFDHKEQLNLCIKQRRSFLCMIYNTVLWMDDSCKAK